MSAQEKNSKALTLLKDETYKTLIHEICKDPQTARIIGEHLIKVADAMESLHALEGMIGATLTGATLASEIETSTPADNLGFRPNETKMEIYNFVKKYGRKPNPAIDSERKLAHRWNNYIYKSGNTYDPDFKRAVEKLIKE